MLQNATITTRAAQPDWKAKMHGWLQSHHGIISSRQLTEMGCPRRTQYNMVSRAELVVVMPGVFRSAHWPEGDEQLMAAACARHDDVLVGFITAARLWKFRRLPLDRSCDIDVLVPHARSLRCSNARVHRCRRIDPVDVVVRSDGIRLTSPTRTLFDCADMIGSDATASILEQLINDGHGTFATHVSTFNRLAHPNRPGTRTMKAVLTSRPRWRRAMQSDLERRILDEIERQGLPRPSVQYRCVLEGGHRVRLDFAWPALKIALEVDHPFWHAGAAESHRDKRRDRKLATRGWQTVRVTDVDVNGGLSESIADVAAVLALRS